MSKRMIPTAVVATLLGVAGIVWAQAPPRPQGPMMGQPMMHGGPGMGMGRGMGMGAEMGMGMGCPMMMPGIDLEVVKLANGASIKLTSSDPKLAARIQKRAEIMRLVHELQEEEP